MRGGAIYGGPTHDPDAKAVYGYPRLPFAPGATAGDGTGAGNVSRYDDGIHLGGRVFRWNASGTPAALLDDLGSDSNGYTDTNVSGVNAAGTAVGGAVKYDGSVSKGSRAVRWDAAGTAVTELGNLGTDSSGFTSSNANGINALGTVVGTAEKYDGDVHLGTRAVRWDASGTAATELGHLGTNDSGITFSVADAVNASGTAVGFENKYDGNSYIGFRAVRWDGSGTAATELDNLGTDVNGSTQSRPYAINSAGRAVGYTAKYDGNSFKGNRAVRWEASGTAVTELGNLGTSNGATESAAYAINATGTAVGFSRKIVNNLSKGQRAVRWDASGTGATELGNLGTRDNGYTDSAARAINAAGTVVGYTATFDSAGNMIGNRAVMWGSDGVAIDLNTLLSSEDGAQWTLKFAHDISDTNWVTGIGIFDPDGGGFQFQGYERMFLIQVPEPASLALMAWGAAIALLPRRR